MQEPAHYLLQLILATINWHSMLYSKRKDVFRKDKRARGFLIHRVKVRFSRHQETGSTSMVFPNSRSGSVASMHCYPRALIVFWLPLKSIQIALAS